MTYKGTLHRIDDRLKRAARFGTRHTAYGDERAAELIREAIRIRDAGQAKLERSKRTATRMEYMPRFQQADMEIYRVMRSLGNMEEVRTAERVAGLRYRIHELLRDREGHWTAGAVVGESPRLDSARSLAAALQDDFPNGVMIEDARDGVFEWPDGVVTEEPFATYDTADWKKFQSNPRLSAAQRRRLPASGFAGPGRSYPDDTPGRARAALARGSEYLRGAPLERLRRRVHRKYPGMRVRGLNPGGRGVIETPFGFVESGEHYIRLTADPDQTYAWAHRPGRAWPASGLSGHNVWAEFRVDGDLVDGDIPDDVGSDEFDAWAFDTLQAAGKEDEYVRALEHTWESRGYGPNPAVLTFAGNPGGRPIEFGRVEKIWYVHATEGPRYHKFTRGTKVEAMPDGSLRIFNPDKRVWEDDGK